MVKEQKKIVILVCFLVLFSLEVFLSLADKAVAQVLEVQYKSFNGQNVTADTKLPDYALYLFNAGVAIGVFSVFISLVVAGGMYALSPISANMRALAKDRAMGALAGLLIIALTYLIITTINPELRFFKFGKQLSTVVLQSQPQLLEGVVFFTNNGCNDKFMTDELHYTTPTTDLGNRKNQIGSVRIDNNPKADDYYMSILYDYVNLQGKCQLLDPRISGCQPTSISVSSASVYRLDLNPKGDGVYFYRKPFFDDSGGYYKVDNSQISSEFFVAKLDDLKFQNVPKSEQNCTKYDKQGNCTNRTPPSLAGENIASVKIKGNYLVVFVYFGPNDKVGRWVYTYCQEFPTPTDIYSVGPRQIKWQPIRNQQDVVPNYVAIIPIKGPWPYNFLQGQ